MRVGVLVVAFCFAADVAVAGRWVVNERGDCIHEWTPSSIARGPLAMVNGITFPGRQLVGGGEVASEGPSGSTSARIVLVPMMALLGFGSGLIEGVFVMAQGLTDFVTGGAFDLVSDESADLSLAPMTPRFLQGIKQAPSTDPCGRPR